MHRAGLPAHQDMTQAKTSTATRRRSSKPKAPATVDTGTATLTPTATATQTQAEVPQPVQQQQAQAKASTPPMPDEGLAAPVSATDAERAPAAPAVRPVASPEWAFGEQDLHLWREGKHGRLYRKLGALPVEGGVRFVVWAPNARAVSVIGDFNDWQSGQHQASPRWDGSGLWEVDVPGARHGQRYKFAITGPDGQALEKADPYARRAEVPPATASIIWDVEPYTWRDDDWMHSRKRANALDAPWSVYELHLGSWRRGLDGTPGSLPDYASAAKLLAEYVSRLGFTHVELMPLTEHPFYGSWGYQTTGYFAPTSRYGTPEELKALVDTLHQAGIGVILDWVPSHFPDDAHGLARFDGTHLYEHADPRQGFHPEWNSSIFNYGRHEVRSFLLSSALYWLDEFHLDGLRVDAVASMLYLDYSRKAGEWVPNKFGGRENLEAIEFLKLVNESAYRDHPDTQIVAEESTSWPMVSRPTYLGGLGFGMKWNMGWMHDTLAYMEQDPVFRRYHHNQLTFSLIYAFNENFMLPLSHDEVVYGKGSLVDKMPGDEWQQFANLRLLLGHMWGHPGKKLLFMGGEFGQRREWAHERELDWGSLDHPPHAGLQRWVEDLNRFYRGEPALYEQDFESGGFEWISGADVEMSVIAYLRRSRSGAPVLVVANFTPVPRENYMVGVPEPGYWQECLNSDAPLYGGSGLGNHGGVDSVPVMAHGRYQSLNLRLPPLGILVFKLSGSAA